MEEKNKAKNENVWMIIIRRRGKEEKGDQEEEYGENVWKYRMQRTYIERRKRRGREEEKREDIRGRRNR